MLYKAFLLVLLALLLTSKAQASDQGISVVAPEEILAEESGSGGQRPLATKSEATEPASAGKVQYLLTRQGFVWEGVIEQGDKTLYVKLPDQSGGVTISRLDVLCIAGSKEELFEYRRVQVNQADIGEVIKLADWGVRHQLTLPAIALLQSIAQTADASVRDMLNKKISQLQYIEKIRLDSLKHKPIPARPEQSGEESRRSEQLRQTEQWGRTIPLAVQDRFLKKIQPVLFRHCSSEGCHRESSKELDFVLYQSVIRSSKRVNGLKNLRSVLVRVNLASPQASRILNHPPITDRHGKPCYPFGNAPDSLKDYETFVDWIGGLSGLLSPSDIRAAGEERPLTAPSQGPSTGTPPNMQNVPDTGNVATPVLPVTGVPAASAPAAEAPVTVEQTQSMIQPATGLTADGQKFLDSQRQAQEEHKRRMGAPTIADPKDAFDPILFNRRYHPEKFK
ncbi:MAG: hypothetical protein PHQ75_00675 [Thermoguttaceae bacterium]|nr:hypothetical protein [Thermoguttaceae bacterium]